MKKIFASMMMLAATSTGFAQQVTAPEPEFINSYCVLTSDSTFDALPKEDGMISKHQNKFGKFAKIAGAIGDLGFAGGMIGASTSGSASGIINGVRVMGTAAGVGQAADAVNTPRRSRGYGHCFRRWQICLHRKECKQWHPFTHQGREERVRSNGNLPHCTFQSIKEGQKNSMDGVQACLDRQRRNQEERICSFHRS